MQHTKDGECSYVIYYRNAKDKGYQRLMKFTDGGEELHHKGFKERYHLLF